MAPEDHKPRPKEGTPASGGRQAPRQQALEDVPTSISKHLPMLERARRILRLLSHKVEANNLLNQVTGTEPSKFVLGVVSSMKGAEEKVFSGTPITIIDTGTDSQFIDLPRKDGRTQQPIVATCFILGEIPPDNFSKGELSRYVHEHHLEFRPMEEGGKPLYLIPAESGVIRTLTRMSLAERIPERELQLDDGEGHGKLEKFLPAGLIETRKLLLAHEVYEGAPLDVNHIHDSLENVTLVLFKGEERKTTMPFAVLMLEGGAKFRLYPYGLNPPGGPTPQGCEVIISDGSYYLIMPEIIARDIENQLMSRHLSLQHKEQRV